MDFDLALEFKYQRLSALLLQKIEAKYWTPGEKLPSIRALAEEFQVAIITVQRALRELENRQIIQARTKSGYYLNYPLETDFGSQATLAEKPTELALSEVFLNIMDRGAAFDFYPNANTNEPSTSLITLQRCITQKMRQHLATQANYYEAPQGSELLREQLLMHYRGLDVHLSKDDVCITSGCQNSLLLALMSCCQPGDTVALESPGFYGALQLCSQLNLKVIELPTSPTLGLAARELQQVCEKWSIKACICSSNFATPTGAVIPYEEKQKLVAVANEYDVALIEDDIYGDLGFSKRPPPLKSLDGQGQVIHCSSFSKSLSRDLRLGWIMGGKYHQKIVRLALTSNLAVGSSVQQGVAKFMAEGHWRRHLVAVRRTLKQQRDHMVSLLRNSWKAPIRYTVPDGGLCLWLEVPKHVDVMVLYQSLWKEKIILTPGPLFSASEQFNNYLRLSFSQPLQEKRLDAFMRLGQALDEFKG